MANFGLASLTGTEDHLSLLKRLDAKCVSKHSNPILDEKSASHVHMRFQMESFNKQTQQHDQEYIRYCPTEESRDID